VKSYFSRHSQIEFATLWLFKVTDAHTPSVGVQIQPSLRDSGRLPGTPNVKTLGYFHVSLRDWYSPKAMLKGIGALFFWPRDRRFD
jgi:hypothetical protein